MKKTALTILTLVLFIGSLRSVSAQDFTAVKAFEDYQHQLTVYNQLEEGFQDAKTFYKKNPTLQLREEARKKTIEMLRQRDVVVATYLTALRMQMVETTGFGDEEKGALYSKIDPEVEWYKNHSTTYLEGDELSTLFTKSDEARDRNTKSTRFISYEAMFDISLSQQIGLRTDYQLVYSDLKNYINDKVAAGTLRIDPFNRWLNDTDKVLVVLSQNEANARKKIANLYSQNYQIATTFNIAAKVLESTNMPLAQLNGYLSELLLTIQEQEGQ